MDVSADETMGEGPHGIGEDIPAYHLSDVLNDLRSVAFYPAPFFLMVQPDLRKATIIMQKP